MISPILFILVLRNPLGKHRIVINYYLKAVFLFIFYLIKTFFDCIKEIADRLRMHLLDKKQ